MVYYIFVYNIISVNNKKAGKCSHMFTYIHVYIQG